MLGIDKAIEKISGILDAWSESTDQLLDEDIDVIDQHIEKHIAVLDKAAERHIMDIEQRLTNATDAALSNAERRVRELIEGYEVRVTFEKKERV